MVLYYSIIFISVCYRGELTSLILIRTLILLLYFYAIYVYDIIEKCLFSYSVSSLLRDTRPNTLLDKFRSGVHTHCCSGKIWSTLRHSFLRNTQTNTLIKKKKANFWSSLYYEINIISVFLSVHILSIQVSLHKSVLSHTIIVLFIYFWISVFM